MRLAALIAFIAMAAAAPLAAAKGDPAPLFASETPIDVTLDGEIRKLVRLAARSTDPILATLTIDGKTYPIELSARGVSRRESGSCDFPPLLVRFAEKPEAPSPFAGQGRLKLVTHCRVTRDFDRFALREYAAYRLYNVLTPESLKVRLARMRYLDGGKSYLERWGFFIEDVDDAAKRMDGKEIDIARVSVSALDARASARTALFEYMIANLDWEITRGPQGSDCCHNAKLIGAKADSTEGLKPIPYDFDSSGLVNTPYAGVPTVVPVANIRTRYYWGYCRHNEEVRAAAADFLRARPALEAELLSIAALSERDREDLRKYLADFFDDIASPELIEKNLLKTCR